MPAFSSIAAGVGAVGSLAGGLGSLFGGGGGGDPEEAARIMADAQMRAANTQAQSAQQARDQIQQYYEYARDNLAPYGRTGQEANWTLASLFLPGGSLDPTETLMATPGYKWLQDQGTEALQRYGSAKGMRNSGAALKGATDYGQNLALTKAWDPYVKGVQYLSGQGLDAYKTIGGWGMNTGSSLAGLTQAEGQALGAGQVNAANALASGQMLGAGDSTMNSIMRSLGVIGGLATNPNIQSFGKSVGDWFGSGSSTPAVEGINNPYAYANIGQNVINSWGGAPVPYALGGPVPQGGRPILVGEQGPEVFVPEQSGYVVPNYALRQPAQTPVPVPSEFTVASPAYAMAPSVQQTGPINLDVDSMVNEIRTLFGG